MVTSVVRVGNVDGIGVTARGCGWRLAAIKRQRLPALVIGVAATKVGVNAQLCETRKGNRPYLLTFEATGSGGEIGGQDTPSHLRATKASTSRSAASTGRPARPPEGTNRYDREHCAVLTNCVAQEPRQRVAFEEVCDLIVQSKGFYRIMEVTSKTPNRYVPKQNAAGGGSATRSTAWK